MKKDPLPRLDTADQVTRLQLLKECRLNRGEFWVDPRGYHVVGCGDAADRQFIDLLLEPIDNPNATLAVHDPPYNLVMEKKRAVGTFVKWCRIWIEHSYNVLTDNSSLYVWMGGDQNDHFQPLGQFMTMMSETDFNSRSLITMRNQRGYGTQQNWMSVRQELLSYAKGKPDFDVQYTEIPRILNGYYKNVGGERKENSARSRSENIRPSNVWVDIQQVFYRMEENVSGCYAQKPLKAIERIIEASSKQGDLVLDFFSHSGTTLLACERLGRRCVTFDLDPLFAELTIRRLERFRATGRTGWQAANPFSTEIIHEQAESVHIV